jgi:predicted O-linked N-acetylglucosamine transferase (SPINDLY family)
MGDYGRGFQPFIMATMADDPARQQACARAWIAQNNPTVPTVPFEPPIRSERLRIGYFSADFEDHATMVLMAGMLERHDRSRFEIHAFSYGKTNDDPARRRVAEAVEHFHDVAAASDAAIVDLARSLKIDLAIDLKGFTHDSRYNLFAHRLAPIQIGYLGYRERWGRRSSTTSSPTGSCCRPPPHGSMTRRSSGSRQLSTQRRHPAHRRPGLYPRRAGPARAGLRILLLQ